MFVLHTYWAIPDNYSLLSGIAHYGINEARELVVECVYLFIYLLLFII